MKTVVVGIGGIGGLLGGRLVAGVNDDANNQIIFWCRGNTLKKIKEDGLTLIGNEGKVNIRPTLATCNPGDVPHADLVLLATKSYSLEEAAKDISTMVTEGTCIIPLLNGLEAPNVLQSYFPQADVLGGCIYVSAHAENPGIVRQIGAVERLLFGKKTLSAAENQLRYGEIEQLLKKSGMNICLTEKIETEMWSKFIFLSPFAGATALYRRTIGEVLANSDSFETVRLMVAEVHTLAKVKQILLPDNIEEITLEKARTFAPSTKTSMQLDQEKGNRTEIESLIAYVCKEGQKYSIPTPTYDTVYSSLKEI